MKHYFLRILGSIVVLKLGYEFGVFDLTEPNRKLAASTQIDMETEE